MLCNLVRSEKIPHFHNLSPPHEARVGLMSHATHSICSHLLTCLFWYAFPGRKTADISIFSIFLCVRFSYSQTAGGSENLNGTRPRREKPKAKANTWPMRCGTQHAEGEGEGEERHAAVAQSVATCYAIQIYSITIVYMHIEYSM